MTIDKFDICKTEQSESSPTPIQQFYAGTNIFITGGTGFLGKRKYPFLKIGTSLSLFLQIFFLQFSSTSY